MSHDYLTEHAGKRLVISYDVHYEKTVVIGDHSIGISDAIRDIVDVSGIGSGIPGVVVDSIRFRIEG